MGKDGERVLSYTKAGGNMGMESMSDVYNVNIGEITDHESGIKSVENLKMTYNRDRIERSENEFYRCIFYYERANLILEIANWKTHKGIFILTDDHPDNDYFLWIMDNVNNYFEYIGEL